MEPFVLLMLTEGAAHGYDLAQKLGSLGFRRAVADPSVLYKLLRALESEGLAESSWAEGDGGPPRRVYTLTRSGEDYLRTRAGDLQRQAKRIATFLERYQTWASQPQRGSGSSGRSRADRG